MPTAGERIAERIVTAIALGEFVPDQRLPTERDLAAMLEASRTTVREVFQRLQAAGYVTTNRGRGGGTFLATDGVANVRDLLLRALAPACAGLPIDLDLRSLPDQTTVRSGAPRRYAKDIAAIRDAVQDDQQAKDRDSSHLADHALHHATARATHNARLVELSASI